MISSALAELSSHMRRAIARRAYGEVQRLAARLGAAAAVEAGAAPEAKAEIAAWLKQEYEHADILLRIGRAQQADTLRRVVFLQRYFPGPDPFSRRVVGNY
jgi:hypothetical protein